MVWWWAQLCLLFACQKSWHMYCSSNPDTLGTKESVLISEVSWFEKHGVNFGVAQKDFAKSRVHYRGLLLNTKFEFTCSSGWDAFWFVCRIWPSQLSCLGSSVGKHRLASWWSWVRVPPEAANFSLKNDCFGRVVLCTCFAFLLCCCCLEVMVHVVTYHQCVLAQVFKLSKAFQMC